VAYFKVKEIDATVAKDFTGKADAVDKKLREWKAKMAS
jgi:hypothetical protein